MICAIWDQVHTVEPSLQAVEPVEPIVWKTVEKRTASNIDVMLKCEVSNQEIKETKRSFRRI